MIRTGVLLLVLLTMFLAACSGAEEQAPAEEEATVEETTTKETTVEETRTEETTVEETRAQVTEEVPEMVPQPEPIPEPVPPLQPEPIPEPVPPPPNAFETADMCAQGISEACYSHEPQPPKSMAEKTPEERAPVVERRVNENPAVCNPQSNLTPAERAKYC